MAIFEMLVGLPGCGKSTYARTKTNFEWVSSDNIRIKNNLTSSQKDNVKVFEIMGKETVSLLKNGANVIYDATNLSTKYRRSILEKIFRIPNLTLKCTFFAVPIEVCKERNANREGQAKVPDMAYSNLLRSFTPPSFSEGWDIITIQGGESRITSLEEVIAQCENLSQCNHHHLHDLLGEHVTAVYKAIEKSDISHSDREILLQVARVHDIGKPETMTIDDSGEGHFYSHANYGAYKYLTCKDVPLNSMSLYIALLVALHINPFNYPAAEHKDVKKYGVETIRLIKLFNKFDAENA